MRISSYSTQTGHSFSDFTITPNFSLGFNDTRLDLLNNARTTHARIHTAQTQTNVRKLRRQKSSLCLAAPHHLKAAEGDGTGHLTSSEGSCTGQPQEAPTTLTACATYPMSTPARRTAHT